MLSAFLFSHAFFVYPSSTVVAGTRFSLTFTDSQTLQTMIPLRDNIRPRHQPVMTRIIIWSNVIVFGIEILMPERHLQTIFYLYGVVPFRFTHPGTAVIQGFPENQYLSLLTSMFLHGGFLHLLTNMWTLWIFGNNVEDKMGPFRFLAFYVLCGVAAMVLHSLTNWGSTVPTIGASGAIAGVLGAYFVLFPRSVVLTFIPIFFFIPILPIPAVVFLFFWFFSQFFNGALAMVTSDGGGGIAWWAHIGGFLAGMFLYEYFLSKKRLRERRPPAADFSGL